MPAIQSILIKMHKPMEARHLGLLRRAAPGVPVYDAARQRLSDEELARVDVFFGNASREFIAALPALRWIQSPFAGVDHLIREGSVPPGVTLCSASIYGPAIAEHMVGMLLMLMKNLHLYRDNQGAQRWAMSQRDIAFIEGCTVLCVGLGDIGANFARRAKALGAHVIGVRRSGPGAPPDYLDEIHLVQALPELLPRADVVALSVPDTSETVHLLDAPRIGAMRQGSYLLNVGRGSAIDLHALVAALDSGHLGGAGLDVTEPEPLPADHPLWHCENAIISPHCSGSYQTPAVLEKIVDLWAENLRRYRAEEPLLNVVDLEKGYRIA